MKKTLLITAALLAGSVQAAPITINFDDGNLHGFVFFSRCSGGGGFPNPPNSTNFYTTPLCSHGDDGGHVGDDGNPVDKQNVRIFREDGRKFSLLGFDAIDEFQLDSSKGGGVYIPFSRDNPTRNFFGSLWSNLDWIEICAACRELDVHGQAAIDNFRFDIRTVPEPPTWELLAMFVGALAFRWRFSRFLHQRIPMGNDIELVKLAA